MKSLANLSHFRSGIRNPAEVRDRKKRATNAIKTTQLSGQALSGERQWAASGNTLDYSSGQALSGERQLAVSGNALDHWVIWGGPQWWRTGSSQQQCHKKTWLSGQALSGERQGAESGSALDDLAIRAGPQWWEAASSQQQCHRRLSYQGRPSVVKDSKQSVAMPYITGLLGQALIGERHVKQSVVMPIRSLD